MRNSAIEKAIELLTNDCEIDMGNYTALDLFARDASWQTGYYANKIKQVYAWEIEERFRDDLVKNLPDNSVVTIGDSHKMISQDKNIYDMIVLDNPQGCYGANGEYCEHFDSLPLSLDRLADNSVLIFNVKTKPFNYNDKTEWQKRRQEFYSLLDTQNISLEFMNKFYELMFSLRGFKISASYNIIRPQEIGLYMFVYYLTKGDLS